jgi:predicted dehydrogenase
LVVAEKVIRWAVVGNGFARQTVLPCLSLIPEVRVAAICARHSDRARQTAERFDIPEVFTDAKAMITETKPDLVFIATPPHIHAELSIFALEQGCHVLCEKPTALDADEARAMLEALKGEKPRVHMIDHQLRFDPGRRKIRELIQEGWIGKVRQVTWTHRSGSMASPETPFTWWHVKSQGGGLLGALGSHAVDMFRFWLGEFEEALACLRTQIPQRPDPATGEPRDVETDDGFTSLLRFREGQEPLTPNAVARMDMNVCAPGPWVMRTEILGTEGSLFLDEAGTLWGCKMGERTWDSLPVKEDLKKVEREKIPDTVWARAFLRFARHITKALLNEEPSVPDAATFEDGLRAQEVLDTVRRASDAGRWVKVKTTVG